MHCYSQYKRHSISRTAFNSSCQVRDDNECVGSDAIVFLNMSQFKTVSVISFLWCLVLKGTSSSSVNVCLLWPTESVGGEDNDGPGAEPTRDLPLVWSGQERPGERIDPKFFFEFGSELRSCSALSVTAVCCGAGGGEPIGECHRSDWKQEPAAAHTHHAVPDTADAKHQPAHHVLKRCDRRCCKWRPCSLPGGVQKINPLSIFGCGFRFRGIFVKT